MRLKSLYMQGFKSFMDKLNLQIQPGISAFVGPNGCGKSNIVDAIRWVMGEQSPKQLRARQMEDLIFSGADALKPLGMTEVTLTLEDIKEFHDASEISVTRRLYRSGESEYLINNAACRLKDIQDLLMGTGLGNRLYSIIAQGEIASIIEQKPEETRFLLEEAAGITKYKLRREASLRKISLTEENLRRVEDLLGEIKREMNSLKRQARKAKRFKEVSSEIHRLELFLHASNYGELHTEKEKRGKKLDDLADEESGLQALFSESEKVIETSNLELIEEEKSLSSLKNSVFSLREECRRHEDALRHLSVDQERFSQADIRLNEEKEEFAQKLVEFRSEIKKINSRIKELQKSIQEIPALRSHYDSLLKDQRVSLDRMKDELKKQKSHLTDLATNEAGLKGEIRNLSEMIKQLEIRKGGLEVESKEIAKKIETLSLLLDEKKERREETSIQISSSEKHIQEERAKLKELEEVRRKKESEKTVAELELNVLRSQLKTTRSLIENYEGFRSGVQKVMNAQVLKTSKEGRILGVVADFIQAEEKFEVAVEAVLAEKLQYVLVARQEDGREAVEYLRSKRVGRCYFLPLEEFKKEKEKSLDDSEIELNGFKLLRDHISVPEKFRPLIESFLGTAALVNNLSQAIYAWKKNGGKQTLVTPEGDLVDKRGVITGGRLGKEPMGLMKRRRTENELRDKIKEKEKLISILQSDLAELHARLDAIENVIAQLETDKEACSQQIEGMDKDMFLLEKESEQLIKHSRYILGQLESLDKEMEEKRSYLTNLEGRLSGGLKETEKIKGIVSEKEAQVGELENGIDDSKNYLSQLLLRYNQQKEEERGLMREKERLDQFICEIGMRIKKMEGQINSNRDQYESSLSKEKELKEGLKVIYQKQKRLEKEGKGVEHKYHILKDKLREEENRSALLRERIRQIREQINEARINEAEIDFQIKSILSQVSKETGINLQRDYERYLDQNFSKAQCEQKLKDYVFIKERMGEVNLLAINEYEKVKQRYEFIAAQRQDLLSSIDSLNNAIKRINRISKERFLSTFGRVDEKLRQVFPLLFNGGRARLRLINENLPLESGVLIEVQPPGKRLVHMGLLSGGEKALAAMALLFAIYLIKPSPFIIMDEVDAPLDEANTDRFNNLLKEIEKSSQVVMVTHNLRTMEVAERLYGVTMDKSGVSKIVSVDLEGYR
ncbi:MAG: chromosome segregation protein SMC [Deltaproteobacteria bacterium]|nr:MAG: chromosome segregation protein SMC [Deltaproteobacteria bacterium]